MKVLNCYSCPFQNFAYNEGGPTQTTVGPSGELALTKIASLPALKHLWEAFRPPSNTEKLWEHCHMIKLPPLYPWASATCTEHQWTMTMGGKEHYALLPAHQAELSLVGSLMPCPQHQSLTRNSSCPCPHSEAKPHQQCFFSPCYPETGKDPSPSHHSEAGPHPLLPLPSTILQTQSLLPWASAFIEKAGQHLWITQVVAPSCSSTLGLSFWLTCFSGIESLNKDREQQPLRDAARHEQLPSPAIEAATGVFQPARMILHRAVTTIKKSLDFKPWFPSSSFNPISSLITQQLTLPENIQRNV